MEAKQLADQIGNKSRFRYSTFLSQPVESFKYITANNTHDSIMIVP
jgi:hypothetical protein